MNARSIDGRIKILRVIARLNIGGPAIHVVLLSVGLDPTRFESLLVSGIENPSEGSLLEHAVGQGTPLVVIPEIVGEATFKPRDVKALVKLCRLIRRERPRIVHTHAAKAGFLGRLAAGLSGVPIVVHTYHGHILHGYFSPLKSWLLRRMEQALAQLTDCIVVVSDQVKRDLVRYGVAPPEKITIIPLGLELQPFLGCAVHRGQFRRELGLTDDARLVGTVGRIFPIKNHRLFLDAATHVAALEPDARFVVVGDGILRPKMEQRAHELGIAERVIFTGWRRDLPRIYADLDVLVVSSDNEGTPVSAIEAMASGLPVVATRVGGLPDLVVEGDTGYLVGPGDAHELATAVLRLLRNPGAAARMGQTARERVRVRFTVERLISDTENLYSELLARKSYSS